MHVFLFLPLSLSAHTLAWCVRAPRRRGLVPPLPRHPPAGGTGYYVPIEVRYMGTRPEPEPLIEASLGSGPPIEVL